MNEFFCSPDSVGEVKSAGGRTISNSNDADIVLITDLGDTGRVRKLGRPFAFSIDVRSSKDVDTATLAAQKGADVVIVSTGDWKIIPLENMIAQMRGAKARILSRVHSPQEVSTMFGILERGVDGVVLPTDRIENVKHATSLLSQLGRLELHVVKVIETRDVGIGERACVDTASMLNMGEGLLIGSKADFLFLIHNESVGSDFTSPRPFRVNAGAVSSYMYARGGKTKYLSEVQAGDEVLIVDSKGTPRTAVVGRTKIERRPLKLVKAEKNGRTGVILVQNAETIRFVSNDEKLISATELKLGDEILAYLAGASARHFGMTVDEYILEK